MFQPQICLMNQLIYKKLKSALITDYRYNFERWLAWKTVP